ncbi:MAG: hypothetical protein IKX60_06230 [Bacteroidales bacterium]|nr:hypothetical protein [Bacteroidales bacterium]
MKRTKKTVMGGVLAMFLIAGAAAPLAMTSCDTAQQPEINLTMVSDYSGIEDMLKAIETAIKQGNAASSEELALIKEAIKAMNGTVSEKLAAIEDAIKSQTTSLETKLGLIEAAVKEGFTKDGQEQDLLLEAIKSLGGTISEKLAAIEAAVKGQTASLETKLGLIEAAVKDGLATGKAEQDLIKQAIESLGGTLAEKIAAIEAAVKSQTTSLETKLAAIEAAVKSGAADSESQQELIQQALESLGEAIGDKLEEIKNAIGSQTSGLQTKIAAIETAVKNEMMSDKDALGLIETAINTVSSGMGSLSTDMQSAVAQVLSALSGLSGSSNDDIVAALEDIFGAIDGLTDFDSIIPAILAAVQEATKPIPNVERQWIQRHAWDGTQYKDVVRDLGYTFKNYSIGWYSTDPEYEAWTLNSSEPYSVSMLDNGWVKLSWENSKGGFYYLFKDVTETSASVRLYYNYDPSNDYESYDPDEYGWTKTSMYGSNGWWNWEVIDPAYPLTWKSPAIHVNSSNYYFMSSSLWDKETQTYLYNSEDVLFNDILGGESGTLPLVVINGFGYPEDFEGMTLDLDGCVVMVKRGELNFADKMRNAAAAGALAVVCVDNQEKGVDGAGCYSLSDEKRIPFFTAPKAVGRQYHLYDDAYEFHAWFTGISIVTVYDPRNMTE